MVMKLDKVVCFRFLFLIFGLDRAQNTKVVQLLLTEELTNRNVLVT